MIAVVQRVASARVTSEGSALGSIGPGLVALVCAVRGDTGADVATVERRIATLRVFADADDRMNLSVEEVGGSVLVVSQFTLAADTRRGRRPSFGRALDAGIAAGYVDDLIERLRARGLSVASGRFGARMQVELVNDGPVTLVLDTQQDRRSSSGDGSS